MMRKTIVCLLCLVMMCFVTACSDTSSDEGDSSTGSADSVKTTGVTEAGYEYTAYVDQESLSCSVEYEGTQIDIDEAEINDEDIDSDYLVLHMTFWNELDLISHDSDVDDPENQAALFSSYTIQAVQGNKVIDPRDEVEAETFEEDNVYEIIDAGSSIECEYWFPVNASKPVKIQILTPDGKDTVMAELEYTPEDFDTF